MISLLYRRYIRVIAGETILHINHYVYAYDLSRGGGMDCLLEALSTLVLRTTLSIYFFLIWVNPMFILYSLMCFSKLRLVENPTRIVNNIEIHHYPN